MSGFSLFASVCAAGNHCWPFIVCTGPSLLAVSMVTNFYGHMSPFVDSTLVFPKVVLRVY